MATRDEIDSLLRLLLAEQLAYIAEVDPSNTMTGTESGDRTYAMRNSAVFQAMASANQLGMAVGVKVDPADPVHPVVAYIDLPTGQVSWHLPAYPGEYDGHKTDEKYGRIRDFQRLAVPEVRA